jgi:hypothetical protein
MSALSQLLSVSRTAQNSPCQNWRALAVIDFDLAVDDYEVNSHWVLIRLFKRRPIDYRLRIEDRNVRKVAFTN